MLRGFHEVHHQGMHDMVTTVQRMVVRSNFHASHIPFTFQSQSQSQIQSQTQSQIIPIVNSAHCAHAIIELVEDNKGFSFYNAQCGKSTIVWICDWNCDWDCDWIVTGLCLECEWHTVEVHTAHVLGWLNALPSSR